MRLEFAISELKHEAATLGVDNRPVGSVSCGHVVAENGHRIENGRRVVYCFTPTEQEGRHLCEPRGRGGGR